MIVLKAILGVVAVALFLVIIFMVYWIAGRVLLYIVAWPKRASERRSELKKQAVLRQRLDHLEAQMMSLSAPAALCHVDGSSPSSKPLESRIGGWPAWPKGKPFPWDDGNKPFLHIAQINLAECPEVPDFPASGILQFFVGGDELWGLEEVASGGGFYVIYHEDLEQLVPQNPYPEGWTNEDVPFCFDTWRTQGLPLRFEQANLPPTSEDFRIEKHLSSLWSDIPNDEWSIFERKFYEPHEKTLFNIGGHPRFTQGDIRGYGNDDMDKTVCLLSMGSVSDKHGKDVMMWGDAGEASFLISPKDLRAKRFDKAIYSWDCS